MRISFISLAFATLASPVFAACPASEQTILSCTLDGREAVVDLCHDARTVTFTFRNTGQGDLELFERMRSLEYSPWNGMGAVMNEVISFENADVFYNIWMTSEMGTQGGDVENAGVTVMSGPDEVIEMQCDHGSIRLGFDAVYYAKQDLGLCYNDDELEWTACD
jgi:hypothetical protein